MRLIRIIVAVSAVVAAASAAPAGANPASAAAERNGQQAYESNDYAGALYWWKIAANNGSAAAENSIGMLYQHGEGVSQDYGQAMGWFQKSAVHGNPMAEYNIGVLFKHGWGVGQDFTQAMSWYQRAASRGEADAQEEIGSLYARGSGVPQDFGQAMAWLQKAAAQGNAAAENNVGLLYLQGAGVPQDLGQALAWFQKAAAQRNAAAENNLASMFERGSGVPADPMQARALYTRAASDGDSSAKQWLAAHPPPPDAGALNATVRDVRPPAPVANSIGVTVVENAEGRPVPLSIAGGMTSVAVTSPPSHGTASAIGMSIIYAPAEGYVGSDRFAYTAANGAAISLPATVSITVSPLTPAAISAPAPVANPVGATVNENAANQPVPLGITGEATSVAVMIPPSHGQAVASGKTVTYTPAGGYTGLDNFAYTATNAAGTSAPAIVSITVHPLEPPPSRVIAGGTTSTNALVSTAFSPPPPVANAVNATVPENALGQPISLSITGEVTSVAVTTDPEHGAVTASGTTITYEPATGYAGHDRFAYTASNASGVSAPAMVSISINPTAPPADSQPAPVANPVGAAITENASGQPISLSITGSATSVAVATQPRHGTAVASGTTISYAPADGFVGSDSFAYTATNATGTSSPAMVLIIIGPTAPPADSQPAPVANPVGAAITENASSQPISLSITGSATSVAVATQPRHGTAVASGTTISYAPADDFDGSDSFAYTATNAAGTSSPAMVLIIISPTRPVANPVSAIVTENARRQPIALDFTGAARSVAVTTPPRHGTATARGTTISYSPADGYSGADSFAYTATNATGTSAPATVSITINPARPQP